MQEVYTRRKLSVRIAQGSQKIRKVGFCSPYQLSAPIIIVFVKTELGPEYACRRPVNGKRHLMVQMGVYIRMATTGVPFGAPLVGVINNALHQVPRIQRTSRTLAMQVRFALSVVLARTLILACDRQKKLCPCRGASTRQGQHAGKDYGVRGGF